MTPAAVFDLDGTLLPGAASERLLFPRLLHSGLLRARGVASALTKALALPLVGATAAVRANKRYLRGASAEEVVPYVEEFVERVLVPRLCPLLLERLADWERIGHPAYLLTGAPDFIARPLARRLGMAGAVATRLSVEGGRYDGRLRGPHYFGAYKSAAVHDLALRAGIDLRESCGFADHAADVGFLECFGHPVAVRPRRGLRRVAERRGWEVFPG